MKQRSGMGGEREMKCKIGECLEGEWGSRCGRGPKEGKSWTDRWNERTLVNKLILGHMHATARRPIFFFLLNT